METISKKIGRRLQEILLNDVGSRGVAISSQVKTLEAAEAAGLLTILHRYEDLGFVDYSLTGKGKELRDAIKDGHAEVINVHDDNLRSMIEMVEDANEQVQRTHEQDTDFDYETLRIQLRALAQDWISHSCRRLGLDPDQGNFRVYGCQPDSDYILAAMDILDSGLPLRMEFTVYNSPLRGRPELWVELEFREEARGFIKKVLTDYPRLLSDVLSSGGGIQLRDHVGDAPELPGMRCAFDELQNYFTDGDPEERFVLRLRFSKWATKQTIRKGILALLALYDAATGALGEQDPDRLIKHHQRIYAKAKPKPRSRRLSLPSPTHASVSGNV